MTNCHVYENAMISSRFFYLSLITAGCTAAAYAVGRHARDLEQQRYKGDLRNWEDEGGSLAPSETPATALPAPAALPTIAISAEAPFSMS
jgi:hypothetical protein